MPNLTERIRVATLRADAPAAPVGLLGISHPKCPDYTCDRCGASPAFPVRLVTEEQTGVADFRRDREDLDLCQGCIDRAREVEGEVFDR